MRKFWVATKIFGDKIWGWKLRHISDKIYGMVVNYFGGGAFKLQSGETSLLVNPESNRFKADVVLRTLAPANFSAEDAVAPNEISFPGEYEIKGIEVLGVAVPEESGEKFVKTVYLVRWEEMNFAFLGHLSRMPSPAIIEKLNEPSVVFLPVDGGHFLAPEHAAKLAKQLEPAIIIPAFHKSPADFLKAMGQKVGAEEKFVFRKKDLAEKKNEVVVLQVKS